LLDSIRQALQPHFHLGWNLFLALVPVVLACWLFRRRERRGWLWWPAFVVFVAFLPNAAYTLTDVIHFVSEVQASDSLPVWSVVYIIIPKYAAFMFIGFQSHVISLILVGVYLRWMGHKNWVLPAEFLLNFLCAIGVYWGRYLRFNSWEIISDPGKIANQILQSLLMEDLGYAVIARYFIVLTAAYYLVKVVDIAVWEYWQRKRMEVLFPARVAAWLPKRSGKSKVVESETAQS
jgi:uncharacterized membrane protein